MRGLSSPHMSRTAGLPRLTMVRAFSPVVIKTAGGAPDSAAISLLTVRR